MTKRRRDPEQVGFTLVEILVTVWILGTAMIVVAGALFTTVRSSDLARRQALAEVELRHYTEAVRAAAYRPCAVSTDYQNDVTADANPNRYVAPDLSVIPATTYVHFWKKTLDSGLPTSFTTEFDDVAEIRRVEPGRCDGLAGQTDDGVQRLDLSVLVTGTPDVTLTTTIVKRNNGLEP